MSAILEAWFAGSSGDHALANILFGDVNPSGKLPITFPKSEADLPHLTIAQPPPNNEGPPGPNHWKHVLEGLPVFQTNYDEGLKVGYKWYDAENKPVLFPFGYGLSYTSYEYSDLKVNPGERVTVSFTVKNTGARAQELKSRKFMRAFRPAPVSRRSALWDGSALTWIGARAKM